MLKEPIYPQQSGSTSNTVLRQRWSTTNPETFYDLEVEVTFDPVDNLHKYYMVLIQVRIGLPSELGIQTQVVFAVTGCDYVTNLTIMTKKAKQDFKCLNIEWQVEN